jgi:hypothetical protein
MQIGDKSSIANLLGVLAGVEAQRAGSAGTPSPDLASATSHERPAGGADGASAALQTAGTRAVRLVGAAMAWLEAHDEQLQRVERGISEQGITRARSLLGAEAFARTWQEGRAMTLEAATAYALEGLEQGQT